MEATSETRLWEESEQESNQRPQTSMATGGVRRKYAHLITTMAETSQEQTTSTTASTAVTANATTPSVLTTTKTSSSTSNFTPATPLTRITATSFKNDGATEDVIVSIDGGEGDDFNEPVSVVKTSKATESRKLQLVVAVLSVCSLSPFFILIIHLAVMFGPIG